MSGPAPALAQGPQDLSGIWSFTHFDDRFQGWVTLQQSGSTLQGTWHTSSGKSEPDTPVTGSVDGAAAYRLSCPPPPTPKHPLILLPGRPPVCWILAWVFVLPTQLDM